MQPPQNLTLLQGDDEQIDITITTENGTPYDLTSATISTHLKPDAPTSDTDQAVTTLTVGNGIEILDAAAGQVRLTIPKTWTATAGTRWWHLVVVKGGTTRTAARGPVTVLDT